MTIKRYLLAGFLVGMVSVIYNYLVFYVFDFYPEPFLRLTFWPLSFVNFYVIIFIKNFLAGLILTVLFSLAYGNMLRDDETNHYMEKGIFYFILYSLFALLAFAVGDVALMMRSYEGMLVMVTLDGLIETLIVTITIKMFFKA
ncbi:MAG: hypothetical protein AAB373_02210 [Patescibacteria group bacterium]